MKTLAIGDCHCKTWIVDEVGTLIDNYDRIIFVGDYADDWKAGPTDTIEMWKALRNFQIDYPDKVKLVIGNHDLPYIHRLHTNKPGFSYVTQVLINSPENRDLRDWLYSIPVIEKIDGVTYSHAGLTANWSGSFDSVIDLWDDDSPLWARPWEHKYLQIPQIFGHTPWETCEEIEPSIWLIDTFSTEKNGAKIGDNSVLEVIDGKEFNVRYFAEIKKEKDQNENNNNPPGFSS